MSRPIPTSVPAALRANLDRVQREIAGALERSGRPAGAVRLVAVTKREPAAAFPLLADIGVTDVGESRVLAGLERRAGSPVAERLRWHLIGHLQRNKVAKALRWADAIHSVDRLHLLDAIDAAAVTAGRRVGVFLQVNVAGEATKGGFSPERCREALTHASSLDNLEVLGWMTMAPFDDNPEVSRLFFRELRQLRDDLNALGIGSAPVRDLSMGMSGDYRVAVEEGSTHVRVGTALFHSVDWPDDGRDPVRADPDL